MPAVIMAAVMETADMARRRAAAEAAAAADHLLRLLKEKMSAGPALCITEGPSTMAASLIHPMTGENRLNLCAEPV